MAPFFDDHMQASADQVLVLLVVLGGLLMGGGPAVQAQGVGDTTRSTPTAVEPADLDSLPGGGDWNPSLAGDTVAADTGEVKRAYVEADSLSTIQRRGRRLQELFGEVFVRQETTRVRSEYALRYLNRDEVLFVDDVVIYERGDTLRADSVRYNRRTEVGRAQGNVRLTNGDVEVRSDRAIYYSSEKRSVFPDSVTLVDSTRVLQARYGTYWSDEARAEFGGGVRLTEPGTTLLADSLTYYRDRERSVARGEVFIDRRGQRRGPQPDTTSRTYLFGDWVDNQEPQRYSRVEGNALLVRVRLDSTGIPTDTLVVKARRLEAFRTDMHRRLVAVGSVRIWQPDLSAVADSAVYDRVVAPLSDSAAGGTVPIDTTRPQPDSTMIIAGRNAAKRDSSGPVQRGGAQAKDALGGRTGTELPSTAERPSSVSSDTNAVSGPRPGSGPPGESSGRPPTAVRSVSAPNWAAEQWDTPTAQSDSVLPIEETRLFRRPVTWFEDSQVSGDSIRVRARNRQPDTVFVRGGAFAARRDSVLDRIQQLKAHNLFAFFAGGSLRRIRAQPNAQAIRFLAADNDSLNGAARTSGDRIILRLRDGAVRRVSVVGGTQTTYYRKNENIPDPFELEGFQWTPGRRPTRQGLLQDPRIEKRLDLDLGPQPRPVARSAPSSGPPAAASADTTSQPPSSRRSAVPQSIRQRIRQTGTVADSLRRRREAPSDSMGTPARPEVPSDTTETNPPQP